MAGQSGKKSETATFIQAARELECDESEDRFNTVLRQVGKHKPKVDEPVPEQKPKPAG